MPARAFREEHRLSAVALVAAGEIFGGVERHVLELAGALAALGVRPRLALFHDAELAARAREQSITPLILDGARRAVVSSADVLAAWLRSEELALVHAHGYKAMVACALARRRTGFEVVKTVHGLPEAVCGWGLSAQRARLYARLEAFATHATHATVCYVTRDLQSRMQAADAGLPTHVVPNGIAPLDAHALAHPRGLDARHFQLAIVGRLDEIKGHRLAIEALAHEGVADDVHLQVAGEGPCAATLQRFAAQLGLAERVHFLGFRRDALAFIAHCDALLLPSLHEGLPYVLLEAMALGTPVIGSRVGGIAEVMQHEATALLTPPGDADALAAAIARMRADRGLREGLATRAAERCASAFSLEQMASRYLEIYRFALRVGEARLDGRCRGMMDWP